MKTITKKPAKKPAKKSVKPAAKAKPAAKVATPVPMKFANLDQLATHIARRLPWARQSGKTSHLRNIKLDPASNGNGLILWYGCRSTMNVISFKVDRNLDIQYSGMDLSKADADIIIAELNKLLKGNCYNAKACVMLYGDAFVPTLPSLPMVKSDIAAVAVPVPTMTEDAANAELANADTDSMPKK